MSLPSRLEAEMVVPLAVEVWSQIINEYGECIAYVTVGRMLAYCTQPYPSSDIATGDALTWIERNRHVRPTQTHQDNTTATGPEI